MNAIPVVTTFETHTYKPTALEIAKEKLRLLDEENELREQRRNLLYQLDSISGRLACNERVTTLLHADPDEYFKIKKADQAIFRIIRNEF